MSEQQRFCRYYPDCAIHRGDPATGTPVPAAEEAEMIRRHQAGDTIWRIAMDLGRSWLTVRRKVPRHG